MAPKVHQGEDAHRRLAELKLGMVDLTAALHIGCAAARDYINEHDPAILPGLVRWGRINGALRERLHERGWRPENPRNLPLAVSPDNTCAIVANTGNDVTGIDGAAPTTRYAKGIATLLAIEHNHAVQMALPFEEFTSETAVEVEPTAEMRTTWILLYRDTQPKIFAELSLPEPVPAPRTSDTGVLSSWSERILIPPFAPE